MRRRSRSSFVREADASVLMERGATEFEEKRIACDFELVFKQVAELGLSSMKETYEFVYRKAYVAGKAAHRLAGGSNERISGKDGEQ